MGRCSVCKQPGHNKRTCKLKVSSHPKDEEYAAAPTLKPPSIPGITTPLNSKLAHLDQKIESLKSSTVDILQQLQYSVDSIKKIEYPIQKAVPVETVTNFCKGCRSKSMTQDHHEDKHFLSNSCDNRSEKEHEHDESVCPSLHKSRAWEKATEFDAAWLIPEARARFKKGPTQKDGPGFIYMYSCLTPRKNEDKGLFKIGMSQTEEGRRRVQEQSNRNQEQYKVLYHEKTPYRYLAENIIHLHLKDLRSPRDHGLGKTEWFRGEKDKLIRIVKDVIREVRFAVENCYFDNPLEL